MSTGAEGAVAVERSTVLTVLIVDDEDSTRTLCRDAVIASGLRAQMASTTEQALEILDQYPIDILITDLRIPQIGGLELLKRVREIYPQTAVMVLTQYGTIDSAVEATRMGAADYVTKPFHLSDLRSKLDRLVRSLEIDQENRVLREQLRTRPGFGGLIGLSPKMQRVYRLIEKVSQHNYPVLILGESGTGKELVARSIHFSGPRRNKPFVPVDCSALVPTLIESELFGYVKGAFTGASHTKQGLMEAADSGTLFLDEIGDLPVDLQAKLLRALQEKEIKPVGSTDRVMVAMRVMAATNRDLDTAVRQGFPSGPLFSPERRADQDSPFAGTQKRYSFTGEFVSGEIQRLRWKRPHDFRGCHGASRGLRLARQCARTRKCHRARHSPGIGAHSCTSAIFPRTSNTTRASACLKMTNSCPSTNSSAGQSCALCAKRVEISWLPPGCSVSARRRSIAS